MSVEPAAPKKKGRPGRPSRPKSPEPAPLGIQQKPLVAGRLIEAVIQHRDVLKRINLFLRRSGSHQLKIDFQSEQISMSAVNHHGTISMSLVLPADKLERYYCGQPRAVSISTKSYNQAVNGGGDVTLFYILEADKMSSLHVLQSQEALSVERSVKLPIVNEEDTPALSGDINEENYQLSFTLDNASLRRSLAGGNTKTSRVHFVKTELGPLTLSLSGASTNQDTLLTFGDSDKIQLTHSLEDADMLMHDIPYLFLHCIISANFAPSVKFLLNEDELVLRYTGDSFSAVFRIVEAASD